MDFSVSWRDCKWFIHLSCSHRSIECINLVVILKVHELNFKITLTYVTVSISGMANGYVAFVMSLVFIGGCTALIGDVAAHLGCFINLKDGVNAIAFVALGTSVPGTTVGLEFSQNFSVLCWVGMLHHSNNLVLTIYFVFYIVYSKNSFFSLHFTLYIWYNVSLCVIFHHAKNTYSCLHLPFWWPWCPCTKGYPTTNVCLIKNYFAVSIGNIVDNLGCFFSLEDGIDAMVCRSRNHPSCSSAFSYGQAL